LIAQFCHERAPEPWQAPSPNEPTLRALVLRLDALQTLPTQESNRLAVAHDVLKEGIKNLLKYLDDEILRMTQEIRRLIDQDPDPKDKQKLLETIPGVGERTIAVRLAFSISPRRFDNARQAVALAGLDPRHHESGSGVHDKPRISKVGYAFLRKALCMPARTTLYHTDWGKYFRSRLSAAGKGPKLIIAAMMRKLIHVALGVLKSDQPFNPALQGI
jgi:transposase